MICRSCTANFNPQSRNKHLPPESKYLSSAKCLDCVIEELQLHQAFLYPKLIKTLNTHEEIKALYFESTKKVSLMNNKFKSIDYEKNIILHNIRMDKLKRKQTVEKTRQPSTKSKSDQLSPDAITAMLANFSPEQREAILKNFKQA